MSDLIKKKNPLLNRTSTQEPKEVFNRDKASLFSEKTIQTKNKIQSTSSIRVSKNTRINLNALKVVEDFDSVEDTINILLTEYINSLTPEKKKEVKYLVDIESRRKWNSRIHKLSFLFKKGEREDINVS